MKFQSTASAEQRMVTAADWLQRMDNEDLPDEQLAQWLDWCGESEENRKAFEDMQGFYRRLREAPQEYREALRADSGIPLHSAGTSRVTERTGVIQRPRIWALAASVVAVAGAALMWYALHASGNDPRLYQTSRGEHRAVTLADGSELMLGADSDVEVRFDDKRRWLTVRHGEAYFKVARDAARPFVVQAGAVRVTAIGTAFNVQRGNSRVSVTVTEGTVDVMRETETVSAVAQATGSKANEIAPVPDSVRLTAGQRTVITGTDGEQSKALQVAVADPAIATAWQEGQLKFVGEPLSSVIDSVNRYASTELVIGDPVVGSMTYTGTVMQGRADEWIANLPQVFPLRLVPIRGGSVLVLEQR